MRIRIRSRIRTSMSDPEPDPDKSRPDPQHCSGSGCLEQICGPTIFFILFWCSLSRLVLLFLYFTSHNIVLDRSGDPLTGTWTCRRTGLTRLSGNRWSRRRLSSAQDFPAGRRNFCKEKHTLFWVKNKWYRYFLTDDQEGGSARLKIFQRCSEISLKIKHASCSVRNNLYLPVFFYNHHGQCCWAGPFFRHQVFLFRLRLQLQL